MVNAQEWLDQNYPINGTCTRKDDKENYGKRRDEIINLDISRQNLENTLDLLGFDNLRKVNMSFNSLFEVRWDDTGYSTPLKLPQIIEEIDKSHNQISGRDGHNWIHKDTLRKLNFSSNNIKTFDLYTPSLTHLDASDNPISSLYLWPSKNLVELNCLEDPLLNNLTLAPSSRPTINGDCAKLVAPTSNSLSNSDKIALGTGIGLGAPGFVATAIGTWLTWKQYKKRKERRRSSQVERTNQEGTELNVLGEGTSLGVTAEEVVRNSEIEQQQYENQIQIPPK